MATPPNPHRRLVVLLAFVHTALLAWSGWRHSPSLDEVGHLPGGLIIWDYGRFDLYRVNPPLVRAVAALPVHLAGVQTDWTRYSDAPGQRSEWDVGADLIMLNGERSFFLFGLARWAAIPFSLIGLWTCWRWAEALYGPLSGVLAAALWCFSPTVIGNGSMITPDMPAAALGLLAAYAFRNWLVRPDWARALLAGMALGLAELAKMTWVILFVVWPLLWLLWRWSTRGETQGTAEPTAEQAQQSRAALLQLAAILLLGLYVLNLGYTFKGTFRRLDTYPFFSRVLAGGETRHRLGDEPGNRFTGTVLGSLRVPLPEDYLIGIDLQKQDFEQGKMSYLRGEHKQGGWWYWYLYAAAMKVPLGTWLLGGVGTLAAFAIRPRSPFHEVAALLLPALAVLVLVSSQTGFSRYFRYALPALPFLFVWASQAARLWRRDVQWASLRCGSLVARKGLAMIAGAGLLWSVASSLYYYPHSLSYFNELAGGPKNGHNHLIDANIDWGQDLLYLRDWIEAHPEARPLTVAYRGFFDEAAAGIDFPETPAAPPLEGRPKVAPVPTDGPQPGWHAISVQMICEYSSGYAYFLDFEPVAYAGYSIHIYHLTPEDAAAAREQLGLPPLPADDAEPVPPAQGGEG